jgi:cytochrome c oxidase subunit 3
MAHEKEHDYHILEPSPWPALGALGAFLMLGGMVFWFHQDQEGLPWLGLIGLALVLYVMYAWWSDVVKESRVGDHTPVVQIGLRYGVIMFIASEVMFFAAWFWSFFKHALYPMDAIDNVWPPAGVEVFDPWHLPLINTLILLCSGAACTWAHHALLENDRKGLVNGLMLSVGLGVIFTILQAYEYGHAAFSFSGSIYGANFFMATGFHGFHVIVGSIFLGVCLIRALKGHFTPQKHIGFEAAAWYWHFVDVLWLFLFACIYIWGR